MYSINNSPLFKIHVPTTATINDIKLAIAKKSKKLPIERQGILVELKGRSQKNNEVLSQIGVKEGGKIYVKDLGPQISWRTVFLAEYAGPIFVYALFAMRLHFIYNDVDNPFSVTAL